MVSKAEREILEVLLEKGPLTARELATAVSEHNWKKQTLNTFLLRLQAKGKVIRSFNSMLEKNIYEGIPFSNYENLFQGKTEEQIAEALMDIQQNMFFKDKQTCIQWLNSKAPYQSNRAIYDGKGLKANQVIFDEGAFHE